MNECMNECGKSDRQQIHRKCHACESEWQGNANAPLIPSGQAKNSLIIYSKQKCDFIHFPGHEACGESKMIMPTGG